MRKVLILNPLALTPRKLALLHSVFSEYMKISNLTLKQLPNAKSQNQLHHLTYKSIRKTSFLPSDIIQEARKDIWAKRKTLKKIGNCSIRLNSRWFKLIKSRRKNPLLRVTYSPGKTFAIPLKKDGQSQRFNSFLSNGWSFENLLLLKNGKIAAVLEKEFPKSKEEKRFVIGIDIGSSTLAAVSVFDTKTSKTAKQLYFGRDVALRQGRYSRRRAKLQSLADKYSERAGKSLEKLKHKQINFVKTRSGQIAKEIVNLAKKFDAGIAIEKLKNIRGKRGKFNRKANRKINRIPYAKFREFLKSNCELFSVPLQEVDAYHTSKWCPHCGALNNGHHSGNHSLYKCAKCGLSVNSDRKASLAIAVKSVLERTAAWSTDQTAKFVQISNTEAPVNGLFRPDEANLSQAAAQLSVG